MRPLAILFVAAILICPTAFAQSECDPPSAGAQGPGLGGPPLPGGLTSLSKRSEAWTEWWEHNRDAYLAFRPPLHGQTVLDSGVSPQGDRAGRAPRIVAEVGEIIVPALKKALEDRNPEVRANACLALGKTGDPALVSLVAEQLADDHPRVRQAAALALGFLRGGDVDSVLLRAVRDDIRRGMNGVPMTLTARAFAALAVGLTPEQTGLDTIKAVVQRREAAHDVHAAAMIALGMLGDERALNPLVNALAKHVFPDEVRAYAAIALGKLGDPRAVPALIAALKDKSGYVRTSAALALGGIRPKQPAPTREMEEVRKRLADPAFSGRAREVLAARLKKLEAEAAAHARKHSMRLQIQKKLHAYALGKGARGTLAARNFAAVSIGRLGGETAVKALMDIHGKVKPAQLRCFACLGLGLAGRDVPNDGILAMLVKTLRTAKSTDRRGAAAIALGLLGRTEAAPAIDAELRRSRDRVLRGHLALAVGMLRYTPAAGTLGAIIEEEENVNLRRNAALALGLMGEESGIDILVGVVRRSKGRAVQSSAAVALGRVGDKRAVKPLVALLLDRRAPSISRASAAVALGLLVEGRDVPLLAQFSAANNYLVPVGSLQQAFEIL